MPNTGDDWLEKTKAGRLARSKVWSPVLARLAPELGISTLELDALDDASEEDELALRKLENTGLVCHEDHVHAEHTDAVLSELMRVMKRQHLTEPPLSPENAAALKLEKPVPVPGPVPPPTAQLVAAITLKGMHMLRLAFHIFVGVITPAQRALFGITVYWGILNLDASIPEVERLTKGYLIHVPGSGDQLNHSRYSPRQSEVFDFPAEDSGKTVFFCLRYEDQKGQAQQVGPWGPVFSSVIP